MMNVEALNNIWSQIKLLKSDFYIVNGNLAVWATADLNIVRCMYVYNPYNLMISTYKTNLDNFLKEQSEYKKHFQEVLSNLPINLVHKNTKLISLLCIQSIYFL